MNTTHKSRRMGPWMSLVASIMLVVALALVLRAWTLPSQLVASASESVAPQPIAALAAASPTPRPTPSSPPTYARALPGPTPPPGALVLALTPAPDGIGWATDLDGKTHFGGPGIHAGFLSGYTYQGALQFDLTSLPSGAAITHAALELTGLDASNLDADASWQLEILPSAIDTTWASLSYQTLRDADSQSSVAVTLATDELGAGKINTTGSSAATTR